MSFYWNHVYIYGGFHKWWVPPIAGWSIMENHIKVEDLGVPPFQETTIYVCVHQLYPRTPSTSYWRGNIPDMFLDSVVAQLQTCEC
jgi:hypothetical protein